MIKSISLIILNLPLILNFCLIILLLIPIKYYNFHPIKFLTILIFLIFLISLKINILFNSWIIFIFPLIIIGGLIIIFIYITRLTNNNLFKINYNNIFINFIKFIILIIIFIYMCIYYNWNLNSQDLWNSQLNNLEENNNEIKINELFNFNKLSILFLIIYLYFSIIIIINICYKLKRPLRQIYFYE